MIRTSIEKYRVGPPMITRTGASHWSGRKSGKYTSPKRLFLLFGVFERFHVFREGIFCGMGGESESETLRRRPSVLGKRMNSLCCAQRSAGGVVLRS